MIVLAFLVGYGTTTKAWPGVADRAARFGYFQNRYDPSGEDVILGGIHSNNATQFINDVLGHLHGPCCRQRTGAEFIIHTMIGSAPNVRHRPPTQAQVDDWIRRVRFAEVTGRVNWNIIHPYTVNSYFQDDWNDAGFFFASGADPSMVFYNPNGTVAYALRRICANPLGDTNGLPVPPPDFRFDGQSFIDGIDRGNPAAPYVTGRKNLLVHPGDTVNFFHFVWNWGTGGGSTRYHAWQHPRNTTPTPSGQWQTAPPMQGAPFRPNPGDIFLNPGQNVLVNWNGFRIPANAQPTATYCQHIGFFWTAWDRPYATDKLNQQACAEVAYSYNLIPTVTADRAIASPGEQVTFSFRVQNQGPTNSRPTDWATTIRTLPPGGAPLPAQDNTTPRLPFDDSSVRTGQLTYTQGMHPIDNGSAAGAMTKTITVNGQPGEKICSSAAINPAAAQGVAIRYSAETCVVIAKTPYSRFMGNDVFAGGNFATENPACNNQANITTVGRTLEDGSKAGSVGEYGVFALGKVTSFGSSSRVLIGSGALGEASRSLTFANSEPDTSKLGYFGAAQHCIPDYISQFDSSPAIASGSYNVGTRGSGQWHVTGNVSLSGTMPAGGQQVYYADGDVTITGNLTYPGSYANAAAIPSLLIITKGNVYVSPNVSQMDGIFVARGNGATSGVFYTCWPKNEPASVSNACNSNALTVNGSVLAARIDLFRSFGASGSSASARKDPGEQFYFSPEVYLRNVINASSQTTVQTTNELELPPRF